MNSSSESRDFDFHPSQLPRSIVVFSPFSTGNYVLSSELTMFGNVRPLQLNLEESFRFARPSDVAWTSWPVISHVSLLFRKERFEYHGTPPIGDLYDLLVAQKCLILDLRYIHPTDHSARASAFARIALVCKMIGQEKPVFVRAPREKDFVLAQDIDFAADALGSLFMESNYAVNFEVLGHQIVKRFFVPEAVRKAEVPTSWGGRAASADLAAGIWSLRAHSPFIFPVVLQYLFALRAASEIELKKTFSAYMSYDDDATFSASERLVDNQWRGSGKYPAIRFGSEGFRKMLSGFWGVGFVKPDFVEEKMVLTDNGLAFLDAMHRTNDDPDCVLRFLNHETGTIPASACGDVEEWLLRFFKKMKQKSTLKA